MKPNLFLISMFNSISLQERKPLEQLLGVLENDEVFMPTDWGNNERIRVDYDSNEIVEKIIMDKQNFSNIFLRCNGPVKYVGSFKTELTQRSFLDFQFEKTMSPKYWQSFFYLSDKIAEIVKPRYGVTHTFWPPSIPWKNDRERMHRWMNLCAQPTPVRFIQHGPMGVGMRTYFGSDVMELFGKDFLMKAPAIVSQLDWGGVCIDLVDKPWEADISDILDSWVEVMNYLESSRVFAIPSFDEQCIGISFSQNEIWKNRNK